MLLKEEHACDNLNAEEKAPVGGKKVDVRSTGVFKDVIITSIPHSVQDDEPQSEWIATTAMKAKLINHPDYPARIPKPRPNLHTVRSTPDMGMGLFAKRDIKRGDLILAERPLLADFVKPPGAVQVINDRTNVDRRIMAEYESLLEAAIARLPPKSQDDFKALHKAAISDGVLEAVPGFAHLPPSYANKFHDVVTSGSDLFRITRSNRYNFRIDCSNHLPEGTYGAVFKIASRINHSCMPNVLRYTKVSSFSMQFYAIRDIKAGEQLFSSYCRLDSNISQRQEALILYGLICRCPACVNVTPKTDHLRATFIHQIDQFVKLIRDPSKINQTLLEKALALEEDLLKEGLDAHCKFGTLLQVICYAFQRLGKAQESQAYLMLVMEFRIAIKLDEK